MGELDSGLLISRSTLRFLGRDSLFSFLSCASLAIKEQFGDWDRLQLTDTSPEIITVARTTGLVEAACQRGQGCHVFLLVEAYTYRGFVLRDGFQFTTVVVVEERQLEVRKGAAIASAGFLNRFEEGCKASSFPHTHHAPGCQARAKLFQPDTHRALARPVQ